MHTFHTLHRPKKRSYITPILFCRTWVHIILHLEFLSIQMMSILMSLYHFPFFLRIIKLIATISKVSLLTIFIELNILSSIFILEFWRSNTNNTNTTKNPKRKIVFIILTIPLLSLQNFSIVDLYLIIYIFLFIS